MTLFYFIVIAIVYIMTMHLAVKSSSGFNNFQIVTLFVVGGVLGWALDSYLTGFVFAMIMHLMFW
ncbi:MAG: hypothetical protein O3B87_00685 [bacterium]|nr:hypothetical protein [bacterium]